ncbi:MAG: DUF4194 domain-containing protein, partial [Muribaculaceae bacterium]|nr:DUF4194 domain-containing protein [Muribaculaceae bacterium]
MDMRNLNELAEMSQKERDEFSRICNMLLSVTYILRETADRRVSKEYRYIEDKFELFYDYLELSGWKIYKESQYGIIYVRNTEGYNKLVMNKLTTVMLATIRIIYEEHRARVGGTNDVCSSVGELFGKIVNEFSVYKKKPPQKEIKEAFRILELHNLIRKIDESYDDFECRFMILPSVLIAVSNERCKAICDMLKNETEESENEKADEAIA